MFAICGTAPIAANQQGAASIIARNQLFDRCFQAVMLAIAVILIRLLHQELPFLLAYIFGIVIVPCPIIEGRDENHK